MAKEDLDRILDKTEKGASSWLGIFFGSEKRSAEIIDFWKEHWQVVLSALVFFVSLIVLSISLFSKMNLGELTMLQAWHNKYVGNSYTPEGVWSSSRLIWLVISAVSLLFSGIKLFVHKSKKGAQS